jgi:ElaB/YqjD/DUF883 family membrane-anchored ribosome-binding protein
MATELLNNQSALGSKKDKLVTDLKGVVADADDLLKEVANSTTEEFVAAREKIEAKLSDTIASLRVARINATRNIHHAADASCDYVRDNPWKVIGIAAAGLAAALIVSRCKTR